MVTTLQGLSVLEGSRMVFEWVTSKFKERQHQKAQIQAEADHMVIVSGLSILNPTARNFFKDMPFYDLKTDSIDFKKLEQYICDLRYWRGARLNKECEECFYQNCNNQFFSDLNEITHSTYKEKVLEYSERKELEELRKEVKQLREDNNILTISDNYNNKIYQKNKEIERLQTLLDEKPVKEVVKVEYKELPQDNRPITRSSKIYNQFRLRVLKRDEVCQCCGSTEDLHVHHISSYKYDKEKRADTYNGIVLCKDCHSQFHSLYGKGHKNNPVNFAKFMREYAKPMQVNLDYVADEKNIFEEILGGK